MPSFKPDPFGASHVQERAKDGFEITVPGKDMLRYKMCSYYDSDEMTTLPNSRSTRAVAGIKRMDVISQGAASIVFRVFYDFSSTFEGAVEISSYIPLGEEKTLIITYDLKAVKTSFADEKNMRRSVEVEKTAAQKKINNFRH